MKNQQVSENHCAFFSIEFFVGDFCDK